MEKGPQPAPAARSGLFWALSYAFISILITLSNKTVLSAYHFDCSMTLTCLQGLVTVIALEIMKKLGYIDFPSFNFATARKVAPLSIVFISYVVVSLISLGRVNVPMFTALRRLTVVFVMIEEYFLLGIVPSMPIIGTVGVMLVGAGIAAWKDMSFDIVSYLYLLLTNFFTSIYTVYINVVKKDTKLNNWAMLYYSNVSSMPFLLLLAIYTGDLQRAVYYPYHTNLVFQINLQLSIFLAFSLNVCTFFSTSVNSARTQTVVGQLKNFGAFLLGLVLFDDYIYDPINFVGLCVGFAGGVLYGFVSFREKKMEKERGAKNATPPNTDGSSVSLTIDGQGDMQKSNSTLAIELLPSSASATPFPLSNNDDSGEQQLQHQQLRHTSVDNGEGSNVFERSGHSSSVNAMSQRV